MEHKSLTPKRIVEELDRFIIGQSKAKRAVAIAMRNRYRRQQLPELLREEVSPKNIIMIGPTGVGKTEIARRIAKLTAAPFVKVEVSKFTEVGYVGRDVDSIVRDLVESAVVIVRAEMERRVRAQAEAQAEERLLSALLPQAGNDAAATSPTREKLRERLRAGQLDDRDVEIEIEEAPNVSGIQILPGSGMQEQMGQQLRDLFGQFGRRKQARTVNVAQARKLLREEAARSLVDEDQLGKEAVFRTEQSGIVFLDEIDKICSREQVRGGDVSREGVQRDLLPLVEGSTVQTKYGPVRTDHVLFIAAGAFHMARVSDLIPELQGRFPIRVELEPLNVRHFVRILREPEHSLPKQYAALLATDGPRLVFDDDAIEALAQAAYTANASRENIGARRLHTILERVLEELSFEASELGEQEIRITAAYVHERVDDLLTDQDLSKHIL